MNLNNAAFDALGPAKSSMEVLAQKKQKFDLIFLDADKPSYITYYKVQICPPPKLLYLRQLKIILF